MADVAWTARSEVAEIERFVDAVSPFVVVVASVAEIADADASIAALIAMRQMNVSVFVFDVIGLASSMLIKNWFDDYMTDHVEMYMILQMYLQLYFFQSIKLWNSKFHQKWIYFVFNNFWFFFQFIRLILFFSKCLLMFC